MNEIEISIVVITYNSMRDKLFMTLDSILKQKDVNYEIIVADDGSKNNYFSEIRKYFINNAFFDYKLVENKVNKGTVSNLFSGLIKANGKYIKVISPGDMLYKKETLRNWIDFIEDNHLQWSFSEVIHYRMHDGIVTPIEVNTNPIDVNTYMRGTEKDKQWNYFAIRDVAVGASMIGLKSIQVEYCQQILNKVIYVEDNMWCMMMFDGKIGGYYPEYTVLYEHGLGISTSKNDIWGERIQIDRRKTDEILCERTGLDKFQRKMLHAESAICGKSKIRKFFIKGFIKNRFFLKERKSIDYFP